MSYLVLNRLSKRYGDLTAVEDLSLSVKRGEFISLLGPSGCGKTTTLQMIAGFVEPSGGSIVLDGKDVSKMPANKRGLGMVFQNYALFPHMTAAENVSFGLEMQRVKKDERQARVADALKLVGLSHLADRHPARMSGGQQQRVALARALVIRPSVLLLDEPLSNLDAKLREEARAFLRELIIRLGLSALMVTHDQSEAMAISDRILLLNNGKIEQQGTPQEMYGSPSTLFTAEFMGSNNRLDGKVTEVRDGRARIEGHGWALWGKAGEGVTQGQDATAVIRVEQVRLADDPDGNHLDMPLLTSMYLGDRWEYLFRTPDADPANTLALRAYGPEGREPGPCRLALPANKVWVFPRPSK